MLALGNPVLAATKVLAPEGPRVRETDGPQPPTREPRTREPRTREPLTREPPTSEVWKLEPGTGEVSVAGPLTLEVFGSCLRWDPVMTPSLTWCGRR
ncbi:hypothetical protein GCM10009744_48670 [Kribbella alba]|uniref:Uncharacterized protein n=1 Tax=Kribbella alba TaxID=190197 RepID=A0ABN2FKF7_9ACTN